MSDSTAILPAKQVAALTSTEAKDLRKLESVIERGQKTFIEVGKALMEINQRKLYRDTHSTFPDYCREKWGFAKSRAYQLIESAKVVGNVHSCGQIEPPANEAQARPLAQLPVAQQANAWQDVVDECKERGEPVTAAAVADVVEKYKAQAEPYREIEPDDDEPDDDGDEELLAAVKQGVLSVSAAAKLVDSPPIDATAPQFRGVGILRGNEAIDALKRIPKSDTLRLRGYQIVADWIKANCPGALQGGPRR